ncbi:hypothetical protein JXA88_07125 [Candidatus Fermentibacteria bacterium]|nr:hypothetical protein [Candidatus Fermentibacteria bacterium]
MQPRSSLDDLLRTLNSALRMAQLYPRGHQSIASSLQRAEEELAALLRRCAAVDLGILAEEIVFQDGDTFQATSGADHLLRILQSHGVDRVTFSQGCSAEDLSELIDVLQQSPEAVQSRGGSHRVLQARGIRTITLNRLTPTALQAKDLARPPDQLDAEHRVVSGLFVHARAGFEGIVESAMSHRPISIGPARAYVYELTQALVEGRSPVLSLALMERHEDEWLTHLVRVTTLAVGYARHLGLTPEQTAALGTASFLYDVGLLALGLRRESASEDERLFQMHPAEGARMLLLGRQVDRLSVVVAFEHHMRYDLSGFPRVSGKRQIHPMAELVGLADEFVDLVTPRSGERGIRSDEAILQLSRLVGKAFSARLFSSFVSMVGVFAPGTFVRLSDGRLAMVVTTNPAHVLRPRVRIITHEDGRAVDRPLTIDLADSGPSITIVAGLDPREHGILPGPLIRPLIDGA